MSSLIIDSHVHMYPFYNTALLLKSLVSNLSRLEPEAMPAAFLTERSDCSFFRNLKASPAAWNDIGLHAVNSEESDAIIIMSGDTPALYLFGGRQIVSSENIEILSLLSDLNISDGRPAADIISAIRDEGGVPAVSWGLGKWFFERGRVVSSLIDHFADSGLYLSDTSMRPGIWPKPLLMRKAEKAGIGLLSGTDPLPRSGQEIMAGRYASVAECDFDPAKPVSSLRKALLQRAVKLRTAGRRRTLAELR